MNAALSQMQEFANTFLSGTPITSLHITPDFAFANLLPPQPPHPSLQLPRGVAHEPPPGQVQLVVMIPCPLALLKYTRLREHKK